MSDIDDSLGGTPDERPDIEAPVYDFDEDDIEWGEIHGDPRVDDTVTVTMPAPPKRALTSADKARRAVALKLAGASYRQIAEKLGYSHPSSAHAAVQRAMEHAQQEDATILRQIHHERLETLLSSVWPLVVRPLEQTVKDKKGKEHEIEDTDTRFKAVDRALSVLDRLDKLHGVSAPTQSEHHVTHTTETVIVARGEEREYIEALEASYKEKTDGEA